MLAGGRAGCHHSAPEEAAGFAAYAFGQVFVHQREADFVVRCVQQVFECPNLAKDMQRSGEEVDGHLDVALFHPAHGG